jgi:hypothetical protein
MQRSGPIDKGKAKDFMLEPKPIELKPKSGAKNCQSFSYGVK